MHLRVVAVLALVLSAGCIGGVPTSRSDQIHIDILAHGEWRVELPLPSDAWIDERWPDILRVSQGNATISFIDGERPLRIDGNGSANLEAFGRWEDPDCCLLAFNQAIWTTGDADRGLVSYAMAGDVRSISISYAAEGCRGDGCDDGEGDFGFCTLETRFVAITKNPGPGMFPRQPVSRTCLE